MRFSLLGFALILTLGSQPRSFTVHEPWLSTTGTPLVEMLKFVELAASSVHRHVLRRRWNSWWTCRCPPFMSVPLCWWSRKGCSRIRVSETWMAPSGGGSRDRRGSAGGSLAQFTPSGTPREQVEVPQIQSLTVVDWLELYKLKQNA